MDVEDLRAKLWEAGIPDSQHYVLTGELEENRLCLTYADDTGWEVYFCKNGQKTGLRQFELEHDACMYFWQAISKQGVLSGAATDKAGSDFEKFPPEVTFTRLSGVLVEYTFSYEGIDIGHFHMLQANDSQGRCCIRVLDIARSPSCPEQYKQEYLGINMFNTAFTVMYDRFKLIPKNITGWFPAEDVGGRDESIRFFKNIPGQLTQYLPYRLAFHLYKDKEETTEILLPAYGAELSSTLEAEKGKDLYFAYAVLAERPAA